MFFEGSLFVVIFVTINPQSHRERKIGIKKNFLILFQNVKKSK